MLIARTKKPTSASPSSKCKDDKGCLSDMLSGRVLVGVGDNISGLPLPYSSRHI